MEDYIDLAGLCAVAMGDYPGNRLYCLVDHAGMPGLHRTLLGSTSSWSSLFNGSSEEAALSAAPILFPVAGTGEPANDGLLLWIAKHGTYTSSLLLLSSPLGLDALRKRLAFRLYAQVSEEMNVLLRFFDPRVFESLLTVLEEPQRAVLLNPADCWWYCDRGGVLRRQACIHAEADLRLSLSAAQEFALLDASEIDQVSAQLQSMLPDAYLRIGAGSREAFFRRHMAQASAAGIAATHEVALFCGLALLHGESFMHTPYWQTVLANVRAGSASFVDAVAIHGDTCDGG